MEHRLSELRALAARLELVAQNAQSNAIVPRPGTHESLLVGTEESFLCLARRLIEIVCEAREAADDPPDSSVNGQPVYAAVDLGLSFDEFSPIWPVHAYLAPDEKAARRVTDALACGSSVPSVSSEPPSATRAREDLSQTRPSATREDVTQTRTRAVGDR